jgi:hypothetical protein
MKPEMLGFERLQNEAPSPRLISALAFRIAERIAEKD